MLWALRVLKSRLWFSLCVAIHAPFVYRNWLYFFFGRFSRRAGVLTLRHRLRFWIRPQSSDRASVTEIQMFHPYSQPVPDSVVLDIGANIGAFSLQAGLTARKVYAVEPIQSNYKMLCSNVILNQAANVIPKRVAVAARQGSAEMSVNGVTSSLHWRQPGTPLETVPTMTLEALLDECGIVTLDYLKMDCEGAEWDVLLNTPRHVFDSIRRIELEYHCFPGSPSPDVLLNHLRAMDFDAVKVRGDSCAGILTATSTRGVQEMYPVYQVSSASH